MNHTLYLLHGWGYDSSFWCPMLEKLSDFTAISVDLGYYSTPSAPLLPQNPYWAVGHSAGVMSLLSQNLPGCLGVISFNGFAQFCQTSDFNEGVVPRILTRMIRRFNTSPTDTIKDFRQMCGEEKPYIPRAIHKERLHNGLKSLLNYRQKSSLENWPGHLHSIIGSHDALEPAKKGLPTPAHKQSLNGGHLLPLTHPSHCASIIRDIINLS